MYKKLALVGLAITVSFLIGAAIGNIQLLPKPNEETQIKAEAEEQKVRDYTLVIQQADFEVSPNVIWHAWTYNGTIPAPTLRVTQGEILRVKVINNLNLTHSFHAHMTDYDMQHDGSQINVITGVGTGSMIPPGEEWVYEYNVDTWGTYFYHCHSADGGLRIVDHILQGLYGAIIVDRAIPRTYIDRDYVIVMSEIGHNMERKGPGPFPPYLMNGKGIPGGEHKLETIFAEKGIEGVAEQFNKTMPVFKAKVGETVRFHVINLGDQIHSFHIHGLKMTSDHMNRGRPWQGTTIPLVQGTLESFIVKPDKEALWLFHCHVVSHADRGMIGLFIVEK